MAKRGRRDLAVGVLFSLALVILALGVMAVGGESRLFVAKAYYRIVFPSAEGLVVGSPVKMSGVVIGTVSDIRLSTEAGEPGIEVEVGIDESYDDRVREDSQAALRILQILSGEKYVELIPGTPESPKLAEGALIPVAQSPELFEQAAASAENLQEITVSLRNLLDALEHGQGLIGTMINDPNFGREGVDALGKAADNLRDITAELRAGHGFAGRLLKDPGFARRVDDLEAALDHASSFLARLDAEPGALGPLLEENGPGEQAVRDLGAAAADLREFTGRLRSGRGLLGKLVYDEEYSQQVGDDLARLAHNLADVAEKVNTGHGTLGALVNERTLYEGAEQVVTGIDDSKFARWLIRRYRKKGIEIQDERREAGEEPAEPAAGGG